MRVGGEGTGWGVRAQAEAEGIDEANETNFK